jgi:hypothetical protein
LDEDWRLMDSPSTKLDLMETGTRYDHYMELVEAFNLGIETVNNMKESHRSTLDIEIRGRLKVTVEMIEKRINYLSGFSTETRPGSDLDRTVYAIEAQRQAAKKLLKGADETQNSDSRRIEENPST